MIPERHSKVWGYEDWIVNTPDYCGKRLFLKEGFRCSLHYHRVKDEAFYVEEGSVLLEIGPETLYLSPGDAVRIPPRTLHRFSGLADSVIFEFSTHHDERDSYRTPDQLSGPIPQQGASQCPPNGA